MGPLIRNGNTNAERRWTRIHTQTLYSVTLGDASRRKGIDIRSCQKSRPVEKKSVGVNLVILFFGRGERSKRRDSETIGNPTATFACRPVIFSTNDQRSVTREPTNISRRPPAQIFSFFLSSGAHLFLCLSISK